MMTIRLSARLKKQGQTPRQCKPQTLYGLVESFCTPEEKRWYLALLKTETAFTQNSTCSPGSNQARPPIDTQSAWLSGFMEAEGTFRSQFYRRKDLKRGYSVDLAVEFRQNGAYDQFHALQARFGGSLRTEGKSTQLRIASCSSVRELKEYFIKYPLRGQKHIA